MMMLYSKEGAETFFFSTLAKVAMAKNLQSNSGSKIYTQLYKVPLSYK